MEIIKNPIIIGFTAGILTYTYLSWDLNEKKKLKKGYKIKEVNLLIPLVVAIIGWFIAYAYLQYNDEIIDNTVISNIGNRKGLPLPLNKIPSYRFTKDIISESSEPKSFSLLTGGVSVPSKLPDVLLDMY